MLLPPPLPPAVAVAIEVACAEESSYEVADIGLVDRCSGICGGRSDGQRHLPHGVAVDVDDNRVNACTAEGQRRHREAEVYGRLLSLNSDDRGYVHREGKTRTGLGSGSLSAALILLSSVARTSTRPILRRGRRSPEGALQRYDVGRVSPFGRSEIAVHQTAAMKASWRGARTGSGVGGLRDERNTLAGGVRVSGKHGDELAGEADSGQSPERRDQQPNRSDRSAGVRVR